MPARRPPGMNSLLRTTVAGLASLFVGLGHPAMAAGGRPVAHELVVTGSEAVTVLELKLDSRVEFAVQALGTPYRLVIDLPEVDFALPDGAGRSGAGLVKAYRFGLFAPGRSRIVIDVDRPFLVEPPRWTKAVGGRQRLVVTIAASDAARFKAALKPKGEAGEVTGAVINSIPKPRLADPRKQRPVVVIDAGHGGIDSGAVSPIGTKEKDIVLALALKLRDKLKESGRYKVVLTRDRDVFIPLHGRVAIATEKGANLFVSIHADSAEDGRYYAARGATIYTRSERASDEAARLLALKENSSDILAGVEVLEDGDTLTNILMDLTLRETRGLSNDFAGGVIGEFKSRTKLTSEPHRQAAFVVLKSPQFPSALIEIGFISNREDEKSLKSEQWRDQMATSIAASIDRFFSRKIADAPF